MKRSAKTSNLGDSLEKDLQTTVISYLKNHYLIGGAWTTDSDRVRNRKFRKGKSGLPDICGYTISGQFFCLELKRERGQSKKRSAQIDFIQRAKESGCIAEFVNSLKEVKELLEALSRR